jgi:hypothetical protein
MARQVKTYLRPEQVISLAIGFGVAIVLHRVTGWWLNSGFGVAVTVSAQFVVSLLLACWSTRRRRERAMSLWVGNLAGMVIALFSVGPGTIWPLVLIIAGIVTAAPVLAGVAVASMLT